jgi:hypothetical protein
MSAPCALADGVPQVCATVALGKAWHLAGLDEVTWKEVRTASP